MGERVVTNVVAVHGQIGNGDCLAVAYVPSIKRCCSSRGVENYVVNTHNTVQHCTGGVDVTVGTVIAVVHAIHADDARHCEFFRRDVRSGARLREHVVRGIGARDGET